MRAPLRPVLLVKGFWLGCGKSHVRVLTPTQKKMMMMIREDEYMDEVLAWSSHLLLL